jgi:hypothetical protein
MSEEQPRGDSATESDVRETVPALSGRDHKRLTAFKWRYSLEASGFSTSQAGRLLFLKWLYGQGMVQS